MSQASTGRSECEADRVLDRRWDGRSTFTVPEAAEILGLSRWLAYEAAKKGTLPTIWIGRRCIVPRRALEKLLTV
jgi:excisionase family DNA binding protein